VVHAYDVDCSTKQVQDMSEQVAKQSENKTTYDPKKSIYDLSGFSILLADDYDFMQALVAAMLKEFGVGSIMNCNNGLEARDLLTVSLAAQQSADIKNVDIILTDWMMPDGSGTELIRWVRNHKKDQIRFMPILLITAFASEEAITEARNNGANEALVKPVSGEKLASRILSVINKPRPFIKTPDFFGPDRRRKDKAIKGEDRRKMAAEEISHYDEAAEEVAEEQSADNIEIEM